MSKSKSIPFDFDSVLSMSPHLYGPSHLALQKKVRAFVTKEIDPFIEEWEDKGSLPLELHRKAAAAGVYAIGFPEEFGGPALVEGAKPDSLHALVYIQEMARCASGGLVASLLTHGIGLPPVLALGSPAMKQKVAPPVLRGEKIICLGITEPFGGSDVAKMKATAVRSPDGNMFHITGEKMFITSGVRADFFTIAARTDKGITLFLLERGMSGLKTRPMEKKMGWFCSDTALVMMDNVPVPKENIIGKEGQGFLGIMLNFNNERLTMAAQATAYARVCLEESILFGRQRQTFGKPLIQHQVIRHKLVDMATKVVTSQYIVEALYLKLGAHHNPETPQSPNAIASFATEICLAKLHCVQAMEFCAREACQIFGGRSFLRGGRAAKVERIYREVRVMAIGGGSEEIMKDLAARQAKL